MNLMSPFAIHGHALPVAWLFITSNLRIPW